MEHRERLYRSREDRVLFGVAGGMAEWLDQDPAIIRLLWALFVVFGGVGLIVYIVAAIVIPEEPFEAPVMTPQYDPAANPGGSTVSGTPGIVGTPGSGTPVAGYASPPTRAQQRAARRAARRAAGPSSGGVVFGVILILIGGWFLLRQFIPWFDFDLIWPLILVGVGIVLVVAALNREPRTGGMSSQPPASAPVEPPAAARVEPAPAPEPPTSSEPPTA